MKELRTSTRQLIIEELDRANKQFPLFASSHEAYGVLEEEYEEVVEALAEFSNCFDKFWKSTKQDKSRMKKCEDLIDARYWALELACESIQVAAMCDKAIISMYSSIKNERKENWITRCIRKVLHEFRGELNA